jgi:WD40 repeat protein
VLRVVQLQSDTYGGTLGHQQFDLLRRLQRRQHLRSKSEVMSPNLDRVLSHLLQWGSGGKVIATLVGHTKRVNSVRWLLGRNNDTELVSGSTDHTAIVWTLRGAQYTLFVLKGHASNVNLVEGLYKGDMTIVVTVGMDSTIIIWTRYPSGLFYVMVNPDGRFLCFRGICDRTSDQYRIFYMCRSQNVIFAILKNYDLGLCNGQFKY